jgi:hypothetical protein
LETATQRNLNSNYPKIGYSCTAAYPLNGLGPQMKNQYVGDINDYRKYTLLRALAGPGDIQIGVCWMLTPSDGRPDGGKIQYLDDPSRYRSYDPDLFDLLRSVIATLDKRHLAFIEASGIVPGARYFDEIIPDDAEGRSAFFRAAMAKLAQSDLIFFDPDNGLDVPSKAKGKRNSSKFIYRDEVTTVFNKGKSVLIYQHFTREERSRFVERIGRSLKDLMPDASIWAFRTAHVVFLFVINPKHAPIFKRRAAAIEVGSDQLFLSSEPAG